MIDEAHKLRNSYRESNRLGHAIRRALTDNLGGLANYPKSIGYGRHLSAECTSCHRIDGVDNCIPSITGWDYQQFRRGTVCVHSCRSYAARIDAADQGVHGAAVLPSVDPASLSAATSWRIPPQVVLDRRINRAYRGVYDRVAPRSPQRLLSPDYWRRIVGRRLGIP